MNILLKKSVQRIILLATSFMIQIGVTIFFTLQYRESFFNFYFASLILSIVIAFIIINNKSNPSYKIAWMIPILIFPIFGGLFYLLYGGNKLSTREKLKMEIQKIKMTNSLKQDQQIMENLAEENICAKNQSKYILDYAKCPVYNNTETTYFKIGEEKYEALLKELEKAQKFIFLEYFIIQEGKMFNSILEILERKAKEGVDVRLIYDDVGCLVTLPHNYHKKLEKKGIKCRVFNPVKLFYTRRLNNRDHRKIVVIDGNVGFTGGINLADEYINEYEKHGYWKDAAIMLKGDAVWNLTIMFLSMWDYIVNIDEDYMKFKPSKDKKYDSIGYVQPFDDSPLVNEPIGETVYLNLINKAQKYIYINTPYLIIDNEMATALKIASKSGVDVKIVTPYIPDKKLVHAVTKSHYESFIKDNIEIYEFTPGFMHAKTFVVDDEYAVVGSINLDFRSLYLHYECGVWMYNTDSISDVKKDYLKTLEKCHKVTMEECKNTSKIRKFGRLLIRMFAPLL